MEELMKPEIRTGDTVRYTGRSRDAGLTLLPGTLGSVVAGPVARRLHPREPARMACQVLFGYRAIWMPVEGLAAD